MVRPGKAAVPIALIWAVPILISAAELIAPTWAELSAATAAVVRPPMLTEVSAPI